MLFVVNVGAILSERFPGNLLEKEFDFTTQMGFLTTTLPEYNIIWERGNLKKLKITDSQKRETKL